MMPTHERISVEQLGRPMQLPKPGHYALEAASEVKVRPLQQDGRDKPEVVFTFTWKDGVTFDIIVGQKAFSDLVDRGSIVIPGSKS